MSYRAILFFCAAILSACGSSQQVRDKDGNIILQEKSGAQAKTGKISTAPSNADKISLIYFSMDSLYIGTKSGVLAKVELSTQRAKVTQVADKVPIHAVSPSGELVLIETNPPSVVTLENALILQMRLVHNFEAGIFGPKGIPLYGADKNGKLRIWGQAHSFEGLAKDERLENFLNRQAPDFLVEFPSIQGPIGMSESGVLFVVDREGVVSKWNPEKPGEIDRIMKVKGRLKSIQATNYNIVTTTNAGVLKVGVVNPPSYLPWSRNVEAEYAALSEIGDTFVLVDNEGLKMKEIQTGKETWNLALPDGTRCGLDISDNGKNIAVCVNHMIYIVDDSGSLIGQFYMDGQNFVGK